MPERIDRFPGDRQCALGRLINAGTVKNLDARGKRSKRFPHFGQSERLQLTETTK